MYHFKIYYAVAALMLLSSCNIIFITTAIAFLSGTCRIYRLRFSILMPDFTERHDELRERRWQADHATQFRDGHGSLRPILSKALLAHKM